MSQTLYHQLSRFALAKAIKTPDDNDPYSEPWSKSIIFTQPFAVELQKQAQAFDINQRTKSQRKPRKHYTCLSSDSEDNIENSETGVKIVQNKHHPRNNHHQQQQHPHRENWKMTKGHSRGSSQTLSSSTDSSSVDDHYNKKKNIKHVHHTKNINHNHNHNKNIAYEDQDPYFKKNRPMMDPVYYQNQHQQQHLHALALQQQQAALERRHNNNKTKTRVTNTDMRRRAEMMRNANDNNKQQQPATPMPRSRYATGPGWSM